MTELYIYDLASRCIDNHRYVDVSTVDGATAKLINNHIKDTGALFLEVRYFGFYFLFGNYYLQCILSVPCHCTCVSVYFNLIANYNAFLIGSSFRLQKACRRWAADFS